MQEYSIATVGVCEVRNYIDPCLSVQPAGDMIAILLVCMGTPNISFTGDDLNGSI